MPTEAEKRLHRCCFSGQRAEKLDAPEEEVRQWLGNQIDAAIAAGYSTFICGMGMGVDIWAGELVVRRGQQNAALHLICVVPWPGFANRWNVDWQARYSALLREADLVVPISHQYRQDVFRRRTEWMVKHSGRLIAYYNGEDGKTREMVLYALREGIEVFTNLPPRTGFEETLKEPGILPAGREIAGSLDEDGKVSLNKGSACKPAAKGTYPEKLIRAIGLSAVFGKEEYTPLNEDQIRGLEHSLGRLPENHRKVLLFCYREGKTLRECGERLGFSAQRAQQISANALKRLRHPYDLVFIRDGFVKTELALKIACAEEMKRCLAEQKARYPEMNEEDIVKFAFQGMMGVGHLISSGEEALSRLREEMDRLEPDMEEPLVEKISTNWVRVNLRAAKARGKTPEDLAFALVCSAKIQPLSFTRQNVYNFCVKLDGSDKMKEAAAHILDENWLPRHSEAYRAAYAPAYRVMYKDYRKFRRNGENESRRMTL